jgi:hypothetical protein
VLAFQSHATVKLKSVLYDPWDLEALFISGSFSSINTWPYIVLFIHHCQKLKLENYINMIPSKGWWNDYNNDDLTCTFDFSLVIACVLMIQTFACYVYTACLSPNLPMETAMGVLKFSWFWNADVLFQCLIISC